MTTRNEHMAWCKERALEYVNIGDLNQAITSMLSDLRMHPETADLLEVGGMIAFGDAFPAAARGDKEGVRKFITGFAGGTSPSPSSSRDEAVEGLQQIKQDLEDEN